MSDKQYLDKEGLQIVAEKVNEAREVGAGAMALAQEVSETSTIAFTGTFAEWNALSASEKAKFAGHIVNITDDTTDVQNAVRNPDWSRKVAIDISTMSNPGYTCPEDGFIMVNIAKAGDVIYILLNGTSVSVEDAGDYASFFSPVVKNNIVSSNVTPTNGYCYFVPYKTEVIVSEPLNYSTEEQFTGKFWIDGKPIYRRTFHQSVNTYTDSLKRRTFSLAYNINVDKIADFNGYFKILANSEYSQTVGQVWGFGSSAFLSTDPLSPSIASGISVTNNSTECNIFVAFSTDASYGKSTSLEFGCWMEYTKSN